MKEVAECLQMSFNGNENNVRWVEAPNEARKASDYI
jgi:hypothetical protein